MSIERIDNNYLAYADNANQVEKVQNGTVSKPVSIHEASKNKENVRVNNFEKKSICLSKQERVIKAQKLRARLSKAKENQAFIGNCWDGVKNFFGKDTGSEHVENQIKAFERGELSEEKIEKIFNEYKIGQEEVVDVTADIVSGIAAVGIYTAAVVATPFTGGASIAVGAAAATATGAAIKTGIKYADASAKGKEYDSVGYDLATGAFSGVLAPITGGVGGAVGKSVATKLGVQAISETGKAMTGNTLKAGAYNMLFNPTGYKYAGGSMLKRAAAFGTECAADGAVGGSVDNMFRASLNGEDIIAAGANGFAGGLVLAPVIGGGIKGAGKAAGAVTKHVLNVKTPEIKVNELEVELRKLGHDDFYIKNVVSSVTEENLPVLMALANIAAKNGGDADGIDKLAKIVTKEDFAYIEELAKLKTNDGKTRFNFYNVSIILEKTTKENMSFVKELVKMTIEGNPRFSVHEISRILTNVTKENMSFVEELVKMTIEGKPRFSGYGVSSILDNVTKENMSFAEELVKMTTEGKPRFSVDEISSILTNVTKKNMSFAEELVKMTTEGNPRFLGYEVFRILGNVTKENMSFAEELVKMTTEGNPRFFGYEVSSILDDVTKENMSFAEELVKMTTGGNPRFSGCEVSSILDNVTKENMSFAEELVKMTTGGNPRFSVDDILSILTNVTKENMPLVKELAEMTRDGCKYFNGKGIAFYLNSNINIKELDEKVTAQLELMKKEPEKYINGDGFESKEHMVNEITKFFNFQISDIALVASILDKDSLNNLMRMRLETARMYLNILKDFPVDKLILFKQLCDSKNIDGKDFCGNQKIEMIDLMKAYIDNSLPFDKMKRVVAEGKVDIEELNRDLFIKVMKDAGLSDDEIVSIPNERFKQWDLKLIHLLAKEIKISREPIFFDVLRLGNLSNNFKKSIHDTTTSYGKANAETKRIFEKTGMNYEKWVTPSKENEVVFNVETKTPVIEQILHISAQAEQEINSLLNSSIIKKQIEALPKYKDCFVDGKFVISEEILSSKENLAGFIKGLIQDLNKFKRSAEGNKTNSDAKKADRAKSILEVFDNLDTILKSANGISSEVKTQTPFKIKMWDRTPQHDIFQGNYSTCCIGLGKGNCSAMPHYLMNTSYNMIELVDNKTGKTIGNALCFFVKGTDGKPKFIIDNIEINNANRSSNEIGINLRTAIADYAAKVAKEVTGYDDTPIYMGQSHNDVPIGDLTKNREVISFLGDVGIDDGKTIYMDLYGGWVEKSGFSNELTLLKLR